jgi:dihydropyrimidinase
VHGGTIVTSERSFAGDIVVRDGRISEVIERGGAAPEDHGAAPERPASAPERPAAARMVDATGLLVLPGVIDVHTHTRLPSDERPDRFYDDSVGAAFGGTTTFLSFNNPGTGISADAQRTLRAGIEEWRAATAGESVVDVGLSAVITAQQESPERDIRWAVDSGVASFKVFLVYDFGVDADRLAVLLAATDGARGLLEVHGEDRAMLDAGIARELEAGGSQPRYHADSRPPEVEAAGTRTAIDVAARVGAPVYFVHVSSSPALDEIARARAAGQPVWAETCPHYLALDASVYESADEICARYVISPPLRTLRDQAALWTALRDGVLDLVATDSVPDRLVDEKRWRGESFDTISNGAPGIETLLSVVWGRGVATGRLTPERAVDVLSTTPARLFGMPAKGAIEAGRDADLVILDPHERWTIRAAEQHHSSDFSLFEGLEVQGRVRRVLVRGEDVVRDGQLVARRGYGRFLERHLA